MKNDNRMKKSSECELFNGGEKGGGKGGGFPEQWLDLIMLYVSSATLLMSIFFTKFCVKPPRFI